MESVMMDHMYSLPSEEDVKSLTITKKMVEENDLLIAKDKGDNSESGKDVVEIEDQIQKKKKATA